jgi:aquaporin Z
MPVRLGGALLVEFIGTFLLVFVGTISIAHAPSAPGAALLPIALAFGITVAVFVSASIHTSGGHINPAVTLGLALTGKIKPVSAVAYIITQCVAAVLGSYAVYALVGAKAGVSAAQTLTEVYGVTDFTSNVGAALLAEFLATFFLVFVIWGSVADPRARNTGGFAIGLAVVADILAIGPLTGASMNPARSFGPSVVASLVGADNAGWDHHWVYWVGPLAGGVLAAVVYHLFLWPRDPKRGIDPDAVDVAVTQRP